MKLNLLLFYQSLAPVLKIGGNMANVISAIDESIDNNDNDNEGVFYSSVDPRDHKVLIYGD